MVKKLLAVGCSYTADIYPFPVWPQLLAEKFNMECINLGRCGSGNEYIYSRTLDTLVTEKNLGLVVVMWSEFQRLDFCTPAGAHTDQKDGKWKTLNYQKRDEIELIQPPGPITRAHQQERNYQFWVNKRLVTLTEDGYDDIVYQTEKSIRLFYSLQQIMKLSEYNNIPFYQLVGSNPCFHKQLEKVAKTTIDSPYLDKINESLFLGWPMLKYIGGWTIDTWLDKVDSGKIGKDSDVRISDEDCHPNKKGHEKITEMLYNEIKKGVPNGSIQTT